MSASREAEDRRGARPLSAYQTAAIVPDFNDDQQQQQQQQQHDDHEAAVGEDLIGITARRAVTSTQNSNSAAAEGVLLDEDDSTISRPLSPHQNSILMDDEDDVLRLLMHDDRADPPLVATTPAAGAPAPAAVVPAEPAPTSSRLLLLSSSRSDVSSEEYLSPMEDNDDDDQDEGDQQQSNDVLSASPYDYDVHWDMVGVRRPDVQDEEEEAVEPKQPSAGDERNNISSCSSLAEAAAASMLATATAAAAAATDRPLSSSDTEVDILSSRDANRAKTMSNRRMLSSSRARSASRRAAHQYSYQYQNFNAETTTTADDNDEQLGMHSGFQDVPLHEDAAHEETVAAPSLNTVDTASEMNESTNTASNSSSSSGTTSMTHRRRTQQRPRRPPAPQNYSRRRPRYPRAASAPTANGGGAAATQSASFSGRSLSAGRLSTGLGVDDASASLSSSSSTTTSGLRASLDSGMAAVRQWVRSRSTSRSSHAARSWQRQYAETSTLSLGEEDLFALSNAGEDPRSRQQQQIQPHRHSEDSLPFGYSSSLLYPPSILEEEGGGEDAFLRRNPRQRALSEPDRQRIRDFFFQRSSAAYHHQGFMRRRTWSRDGEVGGGRGGIQEGGDSVSVGSSSVPLPSPLSAAAINSSLFHSPQLPVDASSSAAAGATMQDTMASSASMATERDAADVSSLAETSVSPPTDEAAASPEDDDAEDPSREARTRWIRINRRFQITITVVALLFSLLLFAILVCWVVLTSAYVVSIDKACDVPLKPYYWLATLQLILDVFRTDIMRCFCRWDTNANERIPFRVITYNIAYLIYAVLVLRLGIRCVFFESDETCSRTAPELFQSSSVFVSLTIAAWSTIVLGYLVPFCFVATLLTLNGYSPTSDVSREREGPHFQGVLPAAYSNSGAPPGCVDQLRTVVLDEFPEEYPHECCICMSDFAAGEVIVATECHHVFHKRCCQEWLRQARTCPVCRTDIPSSLPALENADDTSAANPLQRAFRREEFHQEVANLLQILRRQEQRIRVRNAEGDSETDVEAEDGGGGTQQMGPGMETEMAAMEEGRVATVRQHSNRSRSQN